MTSTELDAIYDRAIKALDKMTPKEIRMVDRGLTCPTCGARERIRGAGGVPNDYCGNCGQHLAWTEEAKKVSPWSI